jgi:hypothetical protein
MSPQVWHANLLCRMHSEMADLTEIDERIHQAAHTALSADGGAVEQLLARVRVLDVRLAAELEACLTMRHGLLVKESFLEGMRFGLAQAAQAKTEKAAPGIDWRPWRKRSQG